MHVVYAYLDTFTHFFFHLIIIVENNIAAAEKHAFLIFDHIEKILS